MQSKAKIDRIIKNSLDAHNKYKLFSSYKRNKLLRKLSKKLILNKSIIINTISKEISKTINDAETEFNRALRTIDFGAEETLRIYGKVYPCDIFADEIQKKAYVGKVPLGIILAVTPYNFPLNIPLHKIIPALSTGNAIIFKPSPLGKKTANLIQKLVIECGFPKNILQTIHCSDSFLQKLLLEEKINMVSYTGSSLFGKKIRSISNISKINLEMGGNNPLIIMKDANLH
ncbi:aldehyde dehydrogenase family protein, partial [Pelagibacteraceae bacterium]|nr:aldehyde dehydrogenase family protein [Pelagibacteraceae bacterium]